MKNTNPNAHLGHLIKQLREDRGMTQADFSKVLHTSQSAVARIEKGNQNVTTGELQKISKALGRRLVTISESMDVEIHGGKKLHGTVSTNTSKNGALGLLCASLLNRAQTTLHGIPRIQEVNRILETFNSIGIVTRWIGKNSLEIQPPKQFKMAGLNGAAAGRIRSILMIIGPLAHKMKEFSLPHAGGCKMGQRTIVAHRYGLEALGINILTKDDHYKIEAKTLKPADIVMYEASDTAAENILMAAALIPGKTTIQFAPPNYQVQEVCFFLEKCGVKIEGIGTTNMVVHGIKDINQKIEYHNSEDPTESMMFLSAAITTGSKLKIERCPIDFLALELLKLEKMGLKYEKSKIYFSHNGRTKLVDITVNPSKILAPMDKLHAQPYPGINTDNLPFFVPIATQAEGATLVHDWMWENRAIYFTELCKLGADITLADPHRVYIHGPKKLRATQIVCPPALRPAMIIMIAMLAAEGKSILRNIYPICRGYEDIVERLNMLGADIRVLQDL
ncbi:MAG: UDP-N-acetylglucosamine 1-carboxyvinyltransferase [bacterium]